MDVRQSLSPSLVLHSPVYFQFIFEYHFDSFENEFNLLNSIRKISDGLILSLLQFLPYSLVISYILLEIKSQFFVAKCWSSNKD